MNPDWLPDWFWDESPPKPEPTLADLEALIPWFNTPIWLRHQTGNPMFVFDRSDEPDEPEAP